MSSLKQRLFNEYDGFADKRIKRLKTGKTFAVDDRTAGDIGSDRQLYSSFCMIFADVVPGETPLAEALEVSLHGNVPHSDGVEAWAKEHGATYRKEASLRIRVRTGEQGILRSLAAALRRITAPGARYAVASYKYACPRSAASLERLANILDQEWGKRAQ